MKTWTLTMIALAGALRCEPLEARSLGGFRLVAETANFAFYARDGRRPDANRCQKFLADTSRLLGQPVDGKTPYYLYDYPDEIPVGNGSRSGVTELPNGHIHSTQKFHAHEIVHRVAGLLGDPGPFFSEGLAVWMAERGVIDGRSVDEIAREARRTQPFRTFVDHFDEADPYQAYATAGSFVGWLVRHHGGLPRFSEFLRRCGRAGFPRGSRFREVFGFGFDEAAELWAQYVESRAQASR